MTITAKLSIAKFRYSVEREKNPARGPYRKKLVSKDPVTTGPDNLPGRLTGNFTGPGIVSRSTRKLSRYLPGPIK